MTQRQLNKLIKIKKILKAKQDEKEPQIIKDYVIDNIIPKNEKILEKGIQQKKFLDNMVENRLFPSMPSDKWQAEHGTLAPPYDEPNNDEEIE